MQKRKLKSFSGLTRESHEARDPRARPVDDYMLQIPNLLNIFHHEFAIKPMIGFELEFYTQDADFVRKALNQAEIDCEFEAESGKNQYEIQLPPSLQVMGALKKLTNARDVLIKSGAQLAAKPFTDQPGSALHMHLNFLDHEHNNLFAKISDHEEPQLLTHIVGGLLATVEEAMCYLAPHEEDYARYQAGIETPSTISWGNNNRTVAIRIPARESGPRRIEHRVASASADPYAVCAAIFAGCIHGLRNKILPDAKIYGNAYLDQYPLKPLPASLEEAREYLHTRQNLLRLLS